MADAELGGSFRLHLDEVAEIIAKSFRRTAVEPGPKRRLAHRLTAALGHALVVVGDAGDHVDVRVDVIWHRILLRDLLVPWLQYRIAPRALYPPSPSPLTSSEGEN